MFLENSSEILLHDREGSLVFNAIKHGKTEITLVDNFVEVRQVPALFF
jgi:hypothetical protein